MGVGTCRMIVLLDTFAVDPQLADAVDPARFHQTEARAIAATDPPDIMTMIEADLGIGIVDRDIVIAAVVVVLVTVLIVAENTASLVVLDVRVEVVPEIEMRTCIARHPQTGDAAVLARHEDDSRQGLAALVDQEVARLRKILCEQRSVRCSEKNMMYDIETRNM